MADLQYPDDLNPFGSDDEGDNHKSVQAVKIDGYPDHLSPFGDDEDEEQGQSTTADNYDNSLNPFSEEDTPPTQPESLEPPPVPLPRTKSLLKKGLAMKNQQQGSSGNHSPQPHQESDQMSSLPSLSSISSSSLPTTTSVNPPPFQRKKNKRNAPPVPINFKRQVLGSLGEIEEELNDIGDKLALLESESNSCQETLKSTHEVDEEQFGRTRARFVEVIKRRNSIVRRQKELMYRKKELKLDQIHSDIEYELRMIGNKQRKFYC